jgi:hypothetical protein
MRPDARRRLAAWAVIGATFALASGAGHVEEIATVDATCRGIEYRLQAAPHEANAGDVAWWDGRTTRRLADHAFLDASQVRSAALRASPPLPGQWDIAIQHTAAGAIAFGAVADDDRERQFAIVVGGSIVQSFAFPPGQKAVHVESTSAGAFPRDVAERLLQEIRTAISACAAK